MKDVEDERNSGLDFVMMNKEECRRMSVAICSKYYHLSTKDPKIVSCGTRLSGICQLSQSGALMFMVQVSA